MVDDQERSGTKRLAWWSGAIWEETFAGGWLFVPALLGGHRIAAL